MKSKFIKASAVYAVMALAIIAIDQTVKYIIASTAGVGEVLAKIPLFEIMYVKNTGAAFSVLEGNVSVLTVISIVFCIAALIYWIIKKPNHPLLKTAIAAMFSGALGNAIDRIAHGFVIDFIRVTFIDFPVFNIADIAITVGAALLIIYEIWFDKSEK